MICSTLPTQHGRLQRQAKVMYRCSQRWQQLQSSAWATSIRGLNAVRRLHEPEPWKRAFACCYSRSIVMGLTKIRATYIYVPAAGTTRYSPNIQKRVQVCVFQCFSIQTFNSLFVWAKQKHQHFGGARLTLPSYKRGAPISCFPFVWIYSVFGAGCTATPVTHTLLRR